MRTPISQGSSRVGVLYLRNSLKNEPNFFIQNRPTFGNFEIYDVDPQQKIVVFFTQKEKKPSQNMKF